MKTDFLCLSVIYPADFKTEGHIVDDVRIYGSLLASGCRSFLSRSGYVHDHGQALASRLSFDCHLRCESSNPQL